VAEGSGDKKGGKLLVLGIANAVDVTKKLAPWLNVGPRKDAQHCFLVAVFVVFACLKGSPPPPPFVSISTSVLCLSVPVILVSRLSSVRIGLRPLLS